MGMDLSNHKIQVKIADSDRFFYVVTVTGPQGEAIEGTYESCNDFEPKTEIPQALCDAITDYLWSANLDGCEHA